MTLLEKAIKRLDRIAAANQDDFMYTIDLLPLSRSGIEATFVVEANRCTFMRVRMKITNARYIMDLGMEVLDAIPKACQLNHYTLVK